MAKITANGCRKLEGWNVWVPDNDDTPNGVHHYWRFVLRSDREVLRALATKVDKNSPSYGHSTSGRFSAIGKLKTGTLYGWLLQRYPHHDIVEA